MKQFAKSLAWPVLGLFMALVPLVTVQAGSVLDEPVSLSKRDVLELLVGNYVHGFKQFGTIVYVDGDILQIDIFYNKDNPGKVAALNFKRQLEKEMPYVMNRYGWAETIPVVVSVFEEDDKGGRP